MELFSEGKDTVLYRRNVVFTYMKGVSLKHNPQSLNPFYKTVDHRFRYLGLFWGVKKTGVVTSKTTAKNLGPSYTVELKFLDYKTERELWNCFGIENLSNSKTK